MRVTTRPAYIPLFMGYFTYLGDTLARTGPSNATAAYKQRNMIWVSESRDNVATFMKIQANVFYTHPSILMRQKIYRFI